MEDNCVFCKIIKGELPSYKIYEDEKTLAFLAIDNDVFGHTLVIPKVHAVNVLDTPEDYLKSVILAVKKIANHYVTNCGFDGVNILNASGESAEQSVFHLHFHIIPRKKGDNIRVWPKFAGEKTSLNDQCDKLKLN